MHFNGFHHKSFVWEMTNRFRIHAKYVVFDELLIVSFVKMENIVLVTIENAGIVGVEAKFNLILFCKILLWKW